METSTRTVSLGARVEDLFWNVLANAATAAIAYLVAVALGLLRAYPIPVLMGCVAVALLLLTAGTTLLPEFVLGFYVPTFLFALVSLAVGGSGLYVVITSGVSDTPLTAIAQVFVALLFGAALINGLVLLIGVLISRGGMKPTS